MQVLVHTSGAQAAEPSPEWVSDWWMPPGGGADIDEDLEALLAPEPVTPAKHIEVTGRPRSREAIAG
jgi:hypothetical protein